MEAYRSSYLHFIDHWAAVNSSSLDRHTDTNTLPYAAVHMYTEAL